ncbi:hypothetical protein FB451DRAFT_443400 [Mycena latifolia]|nr:hypothetical protein FB451DRAFT_443400 [Mycena latifolia]
MQATHLCNITFFIISVGVNWYGGDSGPSTAMYTLQVLAVLWISVRASGLLIWSIPRQVKPMEGNIRPGIQLPSPCQRHLPSRSKSGHIRSFWIW